MESTIVPISSIIQKGVWHYQPYSQAVRDIESLLEQSHYPIVHLRDLVQSIAHGFPRHSRSYQTEGIPILRLKNLTRSGLNLTDMVYISPEEHQKLNRTHLHRGDVLIGLSAPSEIVKVVVYELDRPANIDRQIAVVKVNDRINPDYLTYYLTSKIGQTLLQSQLIGFVIKAISIDSLIKLPVICPSLAAQDKIVANIQSLQDRSEIHARQSDRFQREADIALNHFLRQEAA